MANGGLITYNMLFLLSFFSFSQRELKGFQDHEQDWRWLVTFGFGECFGHWCRGSAYTPPVVLCVVAPLVV